MRLAVAVLALVAALAAPAAAQPGEAAVVSADATVRGVVAQYEAALIRERRLADDREARLISQHEAAMRAARARFDAGAARAQADLERARADYAQLTAQIALRDASARAEIDAYRNEAQGLAAQASPELLAAYQRFADGDQEGAYPVIAALTDANIRAGMRPSHAAVQRRQQAEARNIMRVNGRGGATAAEVLALWDQAAGFDPRDFRTQIERARLARVLNRLDASLSAAQLALEATSDPDERIVARLEIGDVLIARNDLDGALTQFQEGLRTARAAHAADPSYVWRARAVSISLERIGDLLIAQNDLPGALTSYGEGLEIGRRLLAADPSNPDHAYDVLWGVNKVGDVLRAQDDLPGALAHYQEGLEIARSLYISDSSNADRARDLSLSLSRTSGVLLALNDPARALAHQQEGLELARMLYAADRGNAERARDLSMSLTSMGDVLRARDDLAGAMTHYREAVEVARRHYAADRTNAVLARDVWVALARIARYGGGSWRDVVEAMEDAQRRGLLNARDGAFLTQAREFAAQERTR